MCAMGEQHNTEMRKIVILIALLFMVMGEMFAQQRTPIMEGLTLVRYGNTVVVEDDVNQRTWAISVTREKNQAGEWVYKVMCENKYSKAVVKSALSAAISGAVASTGVGSFAAGVAGKISGLIYDDVCDYFGEQR